MLQGTLSAWLKGPKTKDLEYASSKPASSTTTPKAQTEEKTILKDISAPHESRNVTEVSCFEAAEIPSTRNDLSLKVGSHKTVPPEPAAPILSTPSVQPMPPQATIEPITAQHITAFRRLTSLLLPIPYPDSFYKETLQNEIIASLSFVVLWNQSLSTSEPHKRPPRQDEQPQIGRVVAAIRCKLLARPPGYTRKEDEPILYISTIATLSPFRNYALASHLLTKVMKTSAQSHGITTVMAHVWEANEEALKWYKHRGFNVIGREDNYYRKLSPTTALLIRKDIRPSEMLDWT